MNLSFYKTITLKFLKVYWTCFSEADVDTYRSKVIEQGEEQGMSIMYQIIILLFHWIIF